MGGYRGGEGGGGGGGGVATSLLSKNTFSPPKAKNKSFISLCTELVYCYITIDHVSDSVCLCVCSVLSCQVILALFIMSYGSLNILKIRIIIVYIHDT